MRALILNSGMGTRMGSPGAGYPKCMTQVSAGETILSRQLSMLAQTDIREVIMTTGPYSGELVNYCRNLELPLHIAYVENPDYRETNYIYSIYCAREWLDDDILLMHGDLVFENEVLDRVLGSSHSCIAVSSFAELPVKDFKAVIQDGLVTRVGIHYYNGAVAAQPLYKLDKDTWRIWLDKIIEFCESGDAQNRKCYAEDAFNAVSDRCSIRPLELGRLVCAEADCPEDLAVISEEIRKIEKRTVYLCFSTDILHSGHISLLKKARRLGRLIIGVLSDEAVASYKRYPLLPYSERKVMFENMAGVWRTVEQKELSYAENIRKYKPDYVVHGDNWQHGFLRPVRDEAAAVLAEYGGKLAEFPYAADEKYAVMEARARADLAMPDLRRGRLRRLLDMKGFVTAMEAHDGLTGLIVEHTVVYQAGSARQFDAMWVSSLCDSTAKGKPDIELVDMSSRFRTIEDLMEVTTKPVIFDGDTGGRTEHFIYTVRTLERLGVSMVIIEDKTGLKKNSLFGTQVQQTQDSIENFCEKISAGKRAQRTKDFMICARIESLILEQGIADALNRAEAYVQAGADAVMIHSRKKEPDEVFEFIEKFRQAEKRIPVVAVPTSYCSVTEEELKERGANVVIYANQLMRAEVPAIQKTAETILINHRSAECEDMLMPFSDIIRFIPGEER